MNALLVVLALAAPSAQAFTLLLGSQNQVTTGWASSSVTFDIDNSCTSYLGEVRTAINNASQTWGRVPTSSLRVNQGSLTSLPQAITTYVGNSASSYAPAGNPIIYCDANFGSDSGTDPNSIPGFATAQNMKSDGELVGCLLVLNVQVGASANITTLDSVLSSVVLTHEIGHCLGFGHSADPNALMYYATGAGRRLVLAKDDMDAATYLYPDQEAGSSFLGCASVAGLFPPGGSPRAFFGSFAAELALLVLFLIGIRIRPTLRRTP